MQKFTYGSRVIENERTVSLQNNVEKAGSLIHKAVSFLLLFLGVVLLNVLLADIVRNPSIVTVGSSRVFVQGFAFALNCGKMELVYVLYKNVFGFVCAALCGVWACIVAATCFVRSVCLVGEGRHVVRGEDEQMGGKRYGAVAYRYKVRFLS